MHAEPSPDLAPAAYRFNLVFTAACTAMFLFGVSIISLGAILPTLVADFQLSSIAAGTLASILAFGLMVGSVIFGPVVDQKGYRILLLLTNVCIVAGLEGIVISHNIWMLQVSFFLIGTGGGAINGISNALVSEISNDRNDRGSSNLTFLGAFYGVGALSIPTLLAWLIQYTTYQQILAGIGLVCLLPLLLFASISFPSRQPGVRRSLRQSFLKVRDIHLFVFGLFLLLHSGVEGVLNNWCALFMEQGKSLSSNLALTTLSIFILSLTITRLILSILLRTIPALPILILSLLLLLGGLLLIHWGQGQPQIIAGMIAMGAGAAAGFPIMLSYVGSLYPTYRGSAFSVVLFMAVAGNIGWNFMMGILAEHWGIQSFSRMLIALVLGLVVVLLKLLHVIQAGHEVQKRDQTLW